MYTKRIQLVNYGPIKHLDIEFPFEDDAPKPIVLVGANGSGKSILLSHIVNGLIVAKGVAFPDAPEVASGKVYKLRSNTYIKSEQEHYFARVDYADQLYVSELRLTQNKEAFSHTPKEISGTPAEELWSAIKPNTNDYIDLNFSSNVAQSAKVESAFSENCVLYFPFDRSEDPAWLNEDNLNAQAQYMDIEHFVGSTSRQVIAQSPLHEIQNWLFEIIYDRAVVETTTIPVPFGAVDAGQPISLPVQVPPAGKATTIFEIVLSVVQSIVSNQKARFGIGTRLNRVVSLHAGPVTLVPNIFQLSSGETALLTLFLSILRDFDLSQSTLSGPEDVQGIVVVDEIDLHLHTVHQYEILPRLIQLFPRVQFVVSTHSPLFVLGMNKIFGESDFALYRLPQGHRISPEEFGEFEDAYQAFVETRKFNEDVRSLIEASHKPIVFVEGATDQKYIQRASQLLGRQSLIESLGLREGGGSGKLSKIWKDSVLPLTETLPQQVLLLFDCESQKPPAEKGKLVQRNIPIQHHNPVSKGIENLFAKSTLESAQQYNPAFFSTEEAHAGTDENGQTITIPEKWNVNDSKKTNLCEWICENGTLEFFQQFNLVFDLIEDALHWEPPCGGDAETESTQ